MEGVFLPGFGDMVLERPRDVCSNKRVASVEVGFHAELSLVMMEGGVLPQAGCDLSAVFDCKQAKVAVALLEHEVVYLPDMFGGGTEREPGIGEARFGKGGVGAAGVAVFLALVVWMWAVMAAPQEELVVVIVVNETSRSRFVYLL